MSNWNEPTTSRPSWKVPETNATCCVGREEEFPRAEIVALTLFSLTVSGICALTVCFARWREQMALAQVQEDVASQESREERRRQRKESILNGLNVKEWVPDDPPVVESMEGDQLTLPSSGKTIEASQPQILAPQIKSSSTLSCAMGSDDCESLAGEDEMAGCVICLSHFKPQQLICESNNSSCQHVFHKDCMVDWLMKHHESCPMCREVYLLKTV